MTRKQLKQEYYKSKRWQTTRMQTLEAYDHLCVPCRLRGLLALADVVDHLLPFEDKHDPLRDDPRNLYPLCNACHYAVTAVDLVGGMKKYTIDQFKEARIFKYCESIRIINDDGFPMDVPDGAGFDWCSLVVDEAKEIYCSDSAIEFGVFG